MIKIKSISFLLFAVFFALTCFAQSNSELNQISESLKDPYLTVEKAEHASASLRAIEKIKLIEEDRQLLLICFQKVAKGYETNNHFKQACEVYYHYLDLKENFLSDEKKQRISEVIAIENKTKKATEVKVGEMQQELIHLQSEEERASSRSSGIIRYFIFGIVLALCLFLLVFLRGKMILTKNKQELENGRQRLTELQRNNVLGYHYEGIVATVNNDFNRITERIQAISNSIATIRKSSDKKAAQLANSIGDLLAKIEKEVKKISF